MLHKLQEIVVRITWRSMFRFPARDGVYKEDIKNTWQAMKTKTNLREFSQ